MLIAADEKGQIARLFSFLMKGEQLAVDCAVAQARIFPDKPRRQFFANQSRQERFHAQVFRIGISMLESKTPARAAGSDAMDDYRKLLGEALSRGDCMESLLGMQVILEGLGDLTLQRLSAGFTSRGVGFDRVRRVILGQEHAHHGFGIRQLERLVRGQGQLPPDLLNRAGDYLDLATQLMQEAGPLFEFFHEDADDYSADLRGRLPLWLSGGPVAFQER